MQFIPIINPNIIAIIGTWDPPVPRLIALLKELLRYSKKNGLNPYVFLFEPNPTNLLHNNRFKDYFDLDARLLLLKQLGINNVVVLTFTKEELRGTVANFFDELSIKTGIKLSELWVGENQSLGAGQEGIRSIGTECKARNIRLRILKNSFLVNLDKDEVNRNFKLGKFKSTNEIIGYFPTFKCKEDLSINMHDGIYNAMLRSEPFSAIDEIPVIVNITDGHLAELEMHDGYNWLVLLERIDRETTEVQ